MKDVADETVVDAGFQSGNIVEKVVEGIANVLQKIDEDDEYIVIEMANATSQSTLMLTHIFQQMKQIQTIMSQMRTQLKNTNKNGGNYNNTNGENKIKKVPFWRKSY